MAKASRELMDLHPIVRSLAVDFIARAEMELGVKILVTCTLRDEEEQERLYAQGRTAPGNIVTNARAGESFHNWGLAFDIVPVRNGKPVWEADDPIWEDLGRIAKIVGLEWGGYWEKFPDRPHFQYTQGLKIKDLVAGAELNHAVI